MSAPASGGRVYATVAEMLAAQRGGRGPQHDGGGPHDTPPFQAQPTPPSLTSAHQFGSQKRPRSTQYAGGGNGGGDNCTLYFGAVPPHLASEGALRGALFEAVPSPDAIHNVQVRPARGGRGGGRGPSPSARAWVTFSNSSVCMNVLRAIHASPNLSALRARVHTPPVGTAVTPSPSGGGGNAFDSRADLVVANGGLANSLMLRNAPIEMQMPELETVLRSLGAPALRVRTAVSRGGAARNFWLVYSGREMCRAAFWAISKQSVQLRCGKMFRFMPVVHDDSQDAESKKRRRREVALGAQPSLGDVYGTASTASYRSAKDSLEQFLLQDPTLCIFLHAPE